MPWIYGAIALLAGSALAVQVGVNNSLKEKLDGPLVATITSFTTGTLVLILVWVVTRADFPNASQWRSGPWWSWLGGSLGAVYLMLTILFSPRLGAAGWLGVVVTGQILASVLLDHFGLLGFDQHSISWQRAGGVLLLLTGAAVVLRS